MESKSQQYNDKVKILENRINDLQDENKNGEAMLLRQIDELKKKYEIVRC